MANTSLLAPPSDDSAASASTSGLAGQSSFYPDPPHRPDFVMRSGPMSVYGTLDVLTRAVTPGVYAYEADLVRFARIMTSAAFTKEDALELAALPRPVVQMKGSSTEQDLEGDIMYDSALKDMTRCRPNLTIFLNHSYNLPEDMYGSLVRSPWTEHSNGITDLGLQSDVEVINPRAVTTFLYTLRDRAIGVSGGFMVEEAEFIDRKTGKPISEDDLELEDVIFGAVSLGIKHVRAVEFSTVGIPANQRSWVESGTKGYFQRTGKALLAPIVRQLYPHRWADILRELPDATLRQRFEQIEPRKSLTTSGAPSLIYFFPQSGEFKTASGRNYRTLSRVEVEQVMGKAVGDLATHAPTVTKAASDEDKQAQEARSKKYHIGVKEGGNVTKPSAYADVSDDLWGDPVNYRYHCEDKAHADNAAARWGDADNRSQYTADEQAIIERRIKACQRRYGEDTSDAAAADNKGKTVEPDLDKKGGMPRAADVECGADGSHVACKGVHDHSHPAFGSQGDDDMHAHPHAHDGDASHNHPDNTAHQDGMHATDTSVSSAADKTATTETDKTAAGGASGEPAGTPAAPNVPVADDGTHAAMTGRHSHTHAAYGMADGDDAGRHEHAHDHTNDGHHGHDHVSVSAGPGAEAGATVGKTLVPLDADTAVTSAQRDHLLKMYNDLGALLGFAAATADGAGSAQEHTHIAAAAASATQKAVSDVQETAVRTGLTAVDAIVDGLLRQLGIPDSDDFGDGDGDGDGDAGAGDGDDDSDSVAPPTGIPAGPYYAMNASGAPRARKAGRRNSTADLADMQVIHDAIMRLTDGSVCKGATMQAQGDNTPAEGGAGESEQNARSELSGQPQNLGANTHNARGASSGGTNSNASLNLDALPDLIASLKSVGEAAKGVQALAELETRVTKAQQAAETLDRQNQALIRQQQELRDAYEALANVPLPRPTTLTRMLVDDDSATADPAQGVATYTDLRGVNAANRLAARAATTALAGGASSTGMTLEEALALTKKVEIDGVPYRQWPAGVAPSEGRPELSNLQKQYTAPATLWAYRSNEACYIPLRGEKF